MRFKDTILSKKKKEEVSRGYITLHMTFSKRQNRSHREQINGWQVLGMGEGQLQSESLRSIFRGDGPVLY